ncbi:prolyl oligopeptidase family serine peptidase [Anabaena sp. FACHB-1250]|uniref:prolyl oligopeptidase family serine peptidase n=1 Tax=Anabaena sp. FACHB-1250 TaxID=2692770 RepID=UPI0016812FC1|nr:prolyl oligopeptidase family serine peptidase [Anabaena sp. FACHB-1250]MBD2143538.1 prolyl oligopeptidase family serine peptidase [Anabaena sp. FACHB-1250]
MSNCKTSFSYPALSKIDQTDNYYGTVVADPYRTLENPDTQETKAWVEAQNQVTFTYLNEIPAREDIKQRLTKLWDYEKYGTPFKQSNNYFYFKNDGLQNQSVLYTLPTLDAQPRVLLDLNKLSEDGTVALSGISISENGQLLKFAAALQAAHSSNAPVLIRIETKAGHGAGKPTTKIIEEAADKWGFLVRVLGIYNSIPSN